VGAFALLSTYCHVSPIPSAISAIAITFVFRLLAIFFDWRTKSILHPP
jgi:hypothetical protein